jgi:hypothetical protein
MMQKIETLTDGSIVVELGDTDDWDDFAAANAEEIVSRYGSKEKALKHLCDGGLNLGGGAAPEVAVYFAEDDPLDDFNYVGSRHHY